MAYRQIDLGHSVPEPIRLFVGDRVEPYLRDIRWMLTAPTAAEPTGPCLNMSIASMLCAVIGGLGRIFYNDKAGDGECFRAAAKRYPLQDEPPGGVTDPQLFARELYKAYRCGLVHSFGLHMKQSKVGWKIRDAKERYVVARRRVLPVEERELVEMDLPTGQPNGVGATLTRHGAPDAKVRLEVDALYVGVRRLVVILASDSGLQRTAVGALAPWYRALRTPMIEYSSTVSSVPLVQTYILPRPQVSHLAMDSTLGAVSISSPVWGEIKDK